MEAQAEGVQMAEQLQGDLAYSLLRDTCKHDLPQLGEQRRGKAQHAISHQHGCRNHDEGLPFGQCE
jgi:hypothetical protein